MSADDVLLEILKEALGRDGTLSGRRMFGGLGVYFDGVFFAIISDGVIFFRVTDATRPAFAAEGSRPFTYTSKDGPREIHSYWRVPERLLDEVDELRAWGRASVAAARVKLLAKVRKPDAKKARGRGAPSKPELKTKSR